jgi:leucyl aminopeptidase
VRFIAKSENGKDFEYYKSKEGFEFEIQEGQTLEQIRIHAHSIEKHLHDVQTSLLLENGNTEEAYALLEGLLLSSYRFTQHFSKPETAKFNEVVVKAAVTQAQITELENIAKAVFKTRDLVNTPVSHLNAEQLAQAVVEMGKEANFDVKVLEETQIETLKMGGLLAVNKGSIDQPTFTIAEYKPKNAKNKQPIVLVGKGVVYDTGGLSLKPTAGSMDTMKGDMAGAATMAAVIYLAALQKLPVHLVALLPATDNRPGGNAYAPGDVITMFDGTTVEVLNTDAEGRMILADALAYSKKYNPSLVIDAATLTGAALRAIGTEASIIMGNADDHIFDALQRSGQAVHERVVRFPFWEE